MNGMLRIKLFIFLGLCVSACLSIVLIMHQDMRLAPVMVEHDPDLRRTYETRPADDRVLLTLFTAFTEQTSINKLAVENRAFFAPHVKPVLFTTFQTGEFLEKAREVGWDLLPLNRTNYYGQAFIRDMFQTAYRVYNSTFYMYADADIMFDTSLVQTMSFLDGESRAGSLKLPQLFGVGMKTNIYVDDGNLPPFHKVNMVEELAIREKASDERALDYIVTGRYGFKFDGIPDLVADRFACGTRLFTTALDRGMTTIDLTGTLHAIHLVAANRSPPRNVKDDFYNVFQADNWNFTRGNITFTTWQTLSHNQDTMSLYRRQTQDG